jgi:hypothetical protein
MEDADKPFVCYKDGWSLKIVPRAAAGWWALLAWMLALAPICALFIFAMSREPSGPLIALYIAAYLIALALWSVAMIRWMKARSEIVDVAELMKLKRERDLAKRRAGRRH